MDKNKIKAIGYKYGSKVEEVLINKDFASLQEFIEGYLEVIRLEDGLCLIVNELGRLEGLPYNSSFNVYGNFIIAKIEDEKLVSMDELSLRRYQENIKDIIKRRKVSEITI